MAASQLYPNLDPLPWDVDIDMIDSVTGLQFDPKVLNNEFDVKIRINSVEGSLITFGNLFSPTTLWISTTVCSL